MWLPRLLSIQPFLFFFIPADAPTGMIKIPAGYYKPFVKSKGEDSIRIKPFFLDKYPVTNKEFLEFIHVNPQWAKSKVKRIFADENYLRHWENDFQLDSKILSSPVTNVSWFAASAYCKWENKKLPTMNEWDYAASFPPEGPHLNNKDIILKWYGKPSNGIPLLIGKGHKNTLGIYDMHSLIWEWVEDFNSLMTTEPEKAKEEKKKLFCGGGANTGSPEDYAFYMRYAFRSSLKAAYCSSSLGFRCAKN